MKFIEKIKQTLNNKNFTAKLFFSFSTIMFISLSYVSFLYDFKNNDFLNSKFLYITYLFKNLERNFEEKNLIINFKEEPFKLNIEEPALLENLDKRITNRKNLLYISQNAQDKDFNDKDTFMILNSKELKIDIDPEPIIYPVENLRSLTPELSSKEIKEFNQKFYKGSKFYNSSGFNILIIIKSTEVFFLIVISNFLLPFLVYAILYISGYKNINSNEYKNNCLIAMGSYMMVKPILSTYVFEPSFLSILLVLSAVVSVLEKSRLEKN